MYGETFGRRASVAKPTRVRYNDWTKVDLPSLEEFDPSSPVSVIVPYSEGPDELARTLAALEGQSYPRELFEVIIVDEASEPPLDLPPSSLGVTLVRQEGAGFGLARARNNGARAAAHEILVFLNADLLAKKELLAAHARWHHALSDAVTSGTYERVPVDGVSASMIRRRTGSISSLLGNKESVPPPLAEYMDKANGFATKRDDIFRAVSGGSLGIRKRFFDEIGGFDETFMRFGGEDREFAYRAYTRGALLVPEPEAMAWHQRRPHESREEEQNDAGVRRRKLANLIAHAAYRRAAPGRSFLVPEYVVTICPQDGSQEQILHLVETILRGTTHDLVVRLEVSGRKDDEFARRTSRLLGDPRVCISGVQSALDQFPASPFHVVVESGVDFNRDLLGRLREGLGTGVVGKAVVGQGPAPGAQVSITRAWALRRAQRTGMAVDNFGDVEMIDVGSQLAKLRGQVLRAHRLLSAGPSRKGWRDVLRRASFTRLRDVPDFLRWFLRGIGARTSEIVGRRRRRLGEHSPPPSPASKAPAPLGVEIVALGARAARVLEGCPFVSSRLGGGRVDLVVVDTREEAACITAPAVVLSEMRTLAVPAFDPRTINPIGWERDVNYVVGSLGVRRLLPPGVKAHRVVGQNDMNAARLCHHLVDVAAFHSDEIERAGVLVRLAATGTPVYLADGAPGMGALIGNELHALMTANVREAGADERESLSIEMRRIALREHSFRARARQMSKAVLDHPLEVPTVSILLPTKRPGFLDWAIENVAYQNYPQLQLVLALHGDEFEPATVKRAVGRLRLPTRVIRVGANQTLGAVLNAAVKEASGTLLTKMDDDDLYGPDHIWDLVLAHEYSHAQLVGKYGETAYLAHHDQTIVQRRRRAETYDVLISGGALLISRNDLERVGGWHQVQLGEDTALVTAVIRNNGSVYRTHSSGYMVVRHGESHTWELDDSRFFSHAHAVIRGWRPAAADIDNAPDLPQSFLRNRRG